MPRLSLGSLLVWIVVSTQCAAPGRPVRIGLVVWPVYEIPVLARSLGRLDSKVVQLLDYGSPAEALRAYQNGVIDGIALTTSDVVALRSLSSNDRVVLVISVSSGGDALVAAAHIKSVHDLKGRRVAVENGSPGLFMLSRALEHGKLARTDVQVIQVDSNGQQAAFNAGVVDAVVTYEPTRSTLVAQGARDIFNSSIMPNEIVNVLVVREVATRQHAQALVHLTDAWFYALDYLRRDPVDAAARVAVREDLTPASYLASLTGMEILGRDENRRWLSGATPLIDAHIVSLADAMHRAGLVSAPPRVTGLSTDRFIR